MQKTVGFTLIELLVVITIIVILLALLTPAMDKAIYQAELAVCGAQFGGLARGVTTYTTGNSRMYPDRPTVARGMTVVDLYRPVVVPEGTQRYMDDRPVMRLFTTLDAFVDPFVEYVDLSTDDSTFVRTSWHALFFGAGFDPYRRMRRLGDRFGWASDLGGGNIVEKSFDIVACDADVTAFDLDSDLLPHPDADGTLTSWKAQDVPASGEVITYAVWSEATGNVRRGPVDLNYAHADGSVNRLLGVEALTYPPSDERMMIVPFNYARNANTQWPTRVVQLPRQ